MKKTKVKKVSYEVAFRMFNSLVFASTHYLHKGHSDLGELTEAVYENATELFMDYCEFLGIEEVGDEEETDLIDDYTEELFEAYREHLRKEGNW